MKWEEFVGQTVFITGGASGIGKAQAIAFLKNGANVFVLDKVEGKLKETLEQYENHFAYSVGSITNKDSVQQAVKHALNKFKRIDILLNTAGILDGYAKTLETEEPLWDKVMNTNVKGTYFVTNTVLPQMLQQKRGAIINMASIAGFVAGGGGAAYTASKHAIIGYTKQLDYDYCRNGIRANAIAPGAIKTPMNKADFLGDGQMAKWVAEETPAGRWADPSEVADLTLFLASKAADYIHGVVIPIDGGWMNK
ncbi:NAD(P)-dependent dehydrogenase [Virgibacillus pantothenticus]|uniref:3-ketoacyl-ACP reductase n=1 Tax=Virgibacillus pantothenticus TaxID=1473 RepID=A0A0L0QLL3_VIRPA|nr:MULTISPECIES: 3-oxoacyl-ACP reductase [Virgibacillus]API93200.1 3-oxoacyl-ACP reductase [Virgibacillus sp. 6R]KNE19482.1 3-ketoacyl-ACP reductase [Virgibacillus pantothenticus]MBS7428756.1 3-oxoacyl-ACP reductase [Virgibacillus sp. 19R1-5]MBU8565714.1 3-oxoacyl-ACP reductase [Virgibacillus pantothenticus]MBU8599699.1 3-oxoacyl-ACP reductase [Virgibacillus pantothenticus]